ncbi:transcription elongation factor GreB [Pedomonas mirosovicensis]|uniref:transcription elongation factor GreB n=1 Tax=Pedomonas mirosovicensis TaxID=2908641 RepID=UPI0035BC3864
MTPEGWHRLSQEREHLLKVERPKLVETVSWAAGNGDRSENGDYLYGKKRLREIDRRLRYLAKRLESAVVVNPANQPNKTQVFFGASVTYVDDTDTERTVKIVGQDEVDTSRGHVSWVSPVARALMKARVGDVVTLTTPRGPVELEVLDIRYDG